MNAANPLSVEEFARWSGISEYTVRRLCRVGEIKARKIGRRWLIAPGEAQFGGEDAQKESARAATRAQGCCDGATYE